MKIKSICFDWTDWNSTLTINACFDGEDNNKYRDIFENLGFDYQSYNSINVNSFICDKVIDADLNDEDNFFDLLQDYILYIKENIK